MPFVAIGDLLLTISSGLGGAAAGGLAGTIAGGLTAAGADIVGLSALGAAGGLGGGLGALATGAADVLGAGVASAVPGALLGTGIGALTGHPLQGLESGALMGGLGGAVGNILGDIPGASSFLGSNLGKALTAAGTGAGSSAILGGNPLQGAVSGFVQSEALQGLGGLQPKAAAPVGAGGGGGPAVAAPAGVGNTNVDVTTGSDSISSAFSPTGQLLGGGTGAVDSGSSFAGAGSGIPGVDQGISAAPIVSQGASDAAAAIPGTIGKGAASPTGTLGSENTAGTPAQGQGGQYLNTTVAAPSASPTGATNMDYSLGSTSLLGNAQDALGPTPSVTNLPAGLNFTDVYSGADGSAGASPTNASWLSALGGKGGLNSLLALGLIAKGPGSIPFKGQQLSAAQNAQQQGMLLTQLAESGQLLPGQQAQLDAQRQAAMAAILSGAGARGGLGSSATASDLAYTGTQEAATQAGLEQQLMSQGSQYLNMSAQDYARLASEQQQQDQAFSQALAMLTGNLAGLGRNPYYPTQTVPGGP